MYTPLDSVKAVIIGQDPYYNVGMATGLAFSLKPFVKIYPPTLENIFKEYSQDLGFPRPTSGDLTPWAKDGVLLLNSALTVKDGQPNSHSKLGWSSLVEEVIQLIADTHPNAVWILWGNEAKKVVKNSEIKMRNAVISAHPSPLSAHNGFYGSRPFTRTNVLLRSCGMEVINWKLR